METSVMSVLKSFTRSDERLVNIRYPWLSLLLAFALSFYALLMLVDGLVTGMSELLPIPAFILNADYFIAACLVFAVVAWWEYRRFARSNKHVQLQLQKLLEYKRQLQQRAQTAAGNTDKLKMFISDKLLEYIEYDEKYLHFKSIAAEVRHNGVISFDKVQSALLYAAQHSLPDEQGSNATLYQEALSGMRYLWDLLDLSTADNMAMHIGGHISHCEELLFQAELQGTALSALPVRPIFDPQQALIDTLRQHLGAQLCDSSGQQDPALLFANQPFDGPIQLWDKDGLFYIELLPCDALAGNANHFILLLENLLKNARFFATKRQYKSKFPPVAIRLWESQQCICLTLYNRGPHINEDDRSQIFKLGYSTRRAKGHHGKGLGLYFVQQITQGFDGNISFDNINNDSGDYHLRIELANGDVQQLQVKHRVQDGEVLVAAGDEVASTEDFQTQLELNFAAPIQSVHISNDLSTHVQHLDWASEKTPAQHFDEDNKSRPAWLLQRSGRKGNSLIWQPLDVRGVQFSLRLPTVSGRLDGASATDWSEPDVDELSDRLKSPDDF